MSTSPNLFTNLLLVQVLYYVIGPAGTVRSILFAGVVGLALIAIVHWLDGMTCDCECVRCDTGYHCRRREKGCQR